MILLSNCFKIFPLRPDGPCAELLIFWISALTVMWCIGLVIGEFLSSLLRSTWLCGLISSMLFWIQFLTAVWLLMAYLFWRLGVWVLNVFSQVSANASALSWGQWWCCCLFLGMFLKMVGPNQNIIYAQNSQLWCLDTIM